MSRRRGAGGAGAFALPGGPGPHLPLNPPAGSTPFPCWLQVGPPVSHATLRGLMTQVIDPSDCPPLADVIQKAQRLAEQGTGAGAALAGVDRGGVARARGKGPACFLPSLGGQHLLGRSQADTPAFSPRPARSRHRGRAVPGHPAHRCLGVFPGPCF